MQTRSARIPYMAHIIVHTTTGAVIRSSEADKKDAEQMQTEEFMDNLARIVSDPNNATKLRVDGEDGTKWALNPSHIVAVGVTA